LMKCIVLQIIEKHCRGGSVTLPKENSPLDGVNFLKNIPGILKIRPSRSDFQPGGLITLPYNCAVK